MSKVKVSYALSGQIERRFHSSLFFSSKSISARRRSYTSTVTWSKFMAGRCLFASTLAWEMGLDVLNGKKTSPSETRFAPLFLQCELLFT